jgi:NhaP-type Na+/H+ and K+/H+ antiporter
MLMLNFVTIYFYHIIIKNKLVNSIESVTRFAGGLRWIQYIIISIVFVKKVIILKFCQKLSHVFTNY